MGDAAATGGGETRLALCFSVGDALCAFDAGCVQELVRVGATTPVHRAPEHVIGIMNLRGRIVTVIDLRLRLALGRTEVSEDSRILIADWAGEPVGLLLEREAGAVEYDPASVRSPPENVSARFGSMLRGVCSPAGHVVALLDLEAVVATDGRTAEQ